MNAGDKIRWYTILFAISIIGCNSEASIKSDYESLFLEEVMTFPADSSDVIYRALGVTSDIAGNVYVSDNMGFKINKYDSLGKLIAARGTRGAGPGEFVGGPAMIDYSDGKLAIVDLTSPRVHIWSTDLNEVSTVVSPVPVWDVAFSRSNVVYLGYVNLVSKGRNLISYDLSGAKKRSILLAEGGNGDLMYDMGAFTYTNDRKIAFTSLYRNNIEIFSDDRLPILSFTIDGLPNKAPSMDSGIELEGFDSIPEDMLIRDITADSHGNLYLLSGGYSEAKYRAIYVFNAVGDNLGTIVLPSPSRLIHIDHNDFLYVTSFGDTKIVKYRIVGIH